MVFVYFSFSFLFSLFLTIQSLVLLFDFFPFTCYLLYRILGNWNGLSHRRPALMALTFPAAYHNRNVIFFSLVYIAILRLINFSSFFLTVSLRFNGHLTVYWRKI